MSFILKRTETFNRTAKKFLKKHPILINKFKEILFKIEEDPFHPNLKTHKLKGQLKDFYGISLDYKYRIAVTIEIQDKIVVLMDIGSHDEVY